MQPRFQDEHFDILATGFGDLATATAALQEEQRRLTMHRLAVLAANTSREPFVDGMGLLNSLPEAAKTEALGHPNVGLWAAHCVELSKSTRNDGEVREGLRYFGAIAASAAIRARQPFERIDIPLQEDMTGMLPTLGQATFTRSARSAAVEHTAGGSVRIRTPTETVHMPADPQIDAPGWQGLRYLQTQHGDNIAKVELDDVGPYRRLGIFDDAQPAERLTPADVRQWQTSFTAASQFIAEYLPDLAPALSTVMRSIVPLESDPALRMSRATGLGSVALTFSGEAEMAVDLAEQFHNGQFLALHQLYPLHDAPAVERRYYSPNFDEPLLFRDFLASLYRHPIVARMWDIRRGLSAPGTIEHFTAEFEFARWAHRLGSHLHTARGSKRLTKDGLRVLEGVELHKNSLLRAAAPVDAKAARLALFLNIVHRLDWRLYHLQPDSRSAERLGDDFMAGKEPPSGKIVASVSMAAEDTRGPIFARENMIRSLFGQLATEFPNQETLHNPQEALYAPSLNKARETLRENPESRSLWLGLVSLHLQTSERAAHALLSCPEVVRAVCMRIRSAYNVKADPIEVSEWLANVESVEKDYPDA